MKLDLVGKKFNRLSIIEETSDRRRRNIVYKTLCDCGNITLIEGGKISRGHTKSCGCLQKEKPDNWCENFKSSEESPKWKGGEIAKNKRQRLKAPEREKILCK